MRISEVSRISGVPATALRYYESLGLITAGRSANGYREYAVDVLARLDLIEASTELGLPLADVGRHLRALETTSCTDVRDGLRPILAERLRQLDKKRARLDALRRRLGRAEHDLGACPDRDDRCSTGCMFPEIRDRVR